MLYRTLYTERACKRFTARTPRYQLRIYRDSSMPGPMFEAVRAAMDAVLARHPWSEELAGILPLSALIDFLDVPRTLHIFQLTGNQPLWCWCITPSASRLLLSKRKAEDSCNLDRFGASLNPLCLDGRHGDSYHMVNPETLRLYLESLDVTKIPNDHSNMALKDARIQNLEVIHVSRAIQPSWSGSSLRFLIFQSIGWIFFFGLIILSAILKYYMTLGFLSALLLSGLPIYLIHGGPRKLLVEHGSEYNRVVITAMHMNETNWQVFYGESSIVNSVLNRPLSPKGDRHTSHWILRQILRGSILCQWGFAIGAAILKGWDSYFITSWILFCVFSHTYLFPPDSTVKNRMQKDGCLQMNRYKIQLSSRRALLNTILALNPDTFDVNKATRKESTLFFDSALKWIDPILKEGPERTQWLEATRLAMIEARGPPDDTSSQSSDTLAEGNNEERGEMSSLKVLIQSYEKEYWHKFIFEGIDIAAKIRRVAHLSGRYVQDVNGPN